MAAPFERNPLGRRADTIPLIVLIHGTWGSTSKWIQEGSLLRKVLRRRLPGKTEFCPFTWSGRNNHISRLEAAAALRVRLQSMLSENGFRRVFIIAHSHGGNVAGYAMKDFEPLKSIEGIVLIATPFIQVRHRQLKEGGEKIFALMGVLCLFVALGLTIYWGGILTASFLSTTVQVIILFIVTVLFTTFLEVCPPVVPRIRSWIARAQASLSSQLTLEDVPHIPTLTIGVRRDEARRWLSGLRYISNLPAHAFGAISRTANLLYPSLAIGSLLFFGLIASTVGIPKEGSPLWFATGMLVAFPILFVVLWIGAPLLHILMILIPKIFRSHSLGFGGESFLHNWLLDISVSADPPPEWADTEKWEVQESLLARSSLMKHSRIYDTEIVAERIADWITARL